MNRQAVMVGLRSYLRQLELHAGEPDSSELSEAITGSLSMISDHFGQDHVLVRRLTTIGFPNPGLRFYSGQRYRADHTRAVESWIGAVRAAVTALESEGGEPLVDHSHIDAGLWEHVRSNVEAEQWGQVASLTAVYVEDRIRRWADTPRDDVGFVVMGKAFADDGPLALGSLPNERKSWRSLAVGFVGALSNVDRHHVQSRPDIKAYALGVLGTGSLLLTQVRHEHPDVASGTA